MELLAETKSQYVKSEAVLDRKQEFACSEHLSVTTAPTFHGLVRAPKGSPAPLPPPPVTVFRRHSGCDDPRPIQNGYTGPIPPPIPSRKEGKYDVRSTVHNETGGSIY